MDARIHGPADAPRCPRPQVDNFDAWIVASIKSMIVLTRTDEDANVNGDYHPNGAVGNMVNKSS